MISDSGISLDGYCAIWHDWNREGAGVICCITNKICYNTKNSLPKAKPITVRIVYKPPDKTRLLEILSDSLNLLNMLSTEWHKLGDLNIN